MSDDTKINISIVRPPNPYDFSSLCQFLESILHLEGFIEEYPRIITIIENHENEMAKENARKERLSIKLFSDDQFEYALIRTFLLISSALIKFKQYSPQEQDLRRDFLAKDNASNLRNALTTAGFPELFGKSILNKKIEELKSFQISKALMKANSVFERAFYFTLKETELTKKPIDELITGVKQFVEVDDLKQYLETLLYKVEVTTTEKSFESMKRKIAEPLEKILEETILEMEKMKEDPKFQEAAKYSVEQLEEKIRILGEYNYQYFSSLQGKAEIIKDFCGEYFSSDDFIFVDKNLLQFKKAKTEQQDKNSQALLSDDFMATIGNKLMIQLISALKRVYNVQELWLLKAYMLEDLVGKSDPSSYTEQQVSKFMTKKKILLDALKRIRTDMIVEDTYNTASENKKNFLEVFEKELLRLSPAQLKKDVLPAIEKKSGDMVSRAKRMLAKKKKEASDDKIEKANFAKEIDKIGLKVVNLVIKMYLFNTAQVEEKNFQVYMESLEPHAKELESFIKKMGKGNEQKDKKEQIHSYFFAFQQKSKDYAVLDDRQKRLFEVYLKGLVDRVEYW